MFIVHKPKTTALPQLSNLLTFTTRTKLNDQCFIVLNFSCILVSILCLQFYGQSGILVYEKRTKELKEEVGLLGVVFLAGLTHFPPDFV